MERGNLHFLRTHSGPFPLSISLNLQNRSEQQAPYYPCDSCFLVLTSCNFGRSRSLASKCQSWVQAQVCLASKCMLLPCHQLSLKYQKSWLGKFGSILPPSILFSQQLPIIFYVPKGHQDLSLPPGLKIKASLHFRLAPCCSIPAGSEDLKVHIHRNSGLIPGFSPWLSHLLSV